MFSDWRINRLKISGRIIRSGTWEGLADDNGHSTVALQDSYALLAQNHVGLIISGIMYINPMGKIIAPNQLGTDRDDLHNSLSFLAERVHKYKGKLAAQLSHAGGMSSPKILGRKRPLGPSAGIHPVTKFQVEELTRTQIEDIIYDFGQAALRVKKAGFDAVQLHMGHGFLISQFLSKYANCRTDEYGGGKLNRQRFALEVYQEVRRQTGADYPILAKVNAEESGMLNGLDFNEALALMRALDERGIDAIEVSGGVGGWGSQLTPSRKVEKSEDEGYFFNYALQAKRLLACPIISVGGWRSYNKITEALRHVDAIALSRPLICQPDLPARWYACAPVDAQCISCNQCFILNGRYGLRCAQHCPANNSAKTR
jgi:2,4-dienoyl-CoA reductase-like NADH-dependent reductase (Old Yellow Enzyme family)